MPDVFQYTSNTTLAEIADRIRSSESVLISAHTKPDGDAIGSCLALRRSLAAMGKCVEVVLAGPIESTLRAVMGDDPVRVDRPPAMRDADLVLVVDTGSWNQLAPMRSWLEPMRDSIVVIDHHARGDDLAQWRFIETSAASTTMILVDLLNELDVDLTDGGIGSAAEALFIGLATDTGWFRHSNADAAAFAMAARLLRAGVNKNRLYQALEESYSKTRLALEAKALGSLEFVRDGTAAIMALGPGDFAELGASMEDLTGMVNLPMSVSEVQVSVLLAQNKKSQTKLSFRSKPAAGDDPDEDVVNVNLLAQQFDGGGHKHAAGARLDVDLSEAHRLVADALNSI